MIRFLADLLTPIFTDMGVSPVDVQTYADMLSGYIYAILGTLLLAVAVMVAAHWLVKKGTRHAVRWSAGLAWVLVVGILVNVICFGPMYSNLAPIMNGGGSVSPETAASSEAVVEKVGDEGIVLAENNGILPLSDTTKINVFGWASTIPIYGGTGSGSSGGEGQDLPSDMGPVIDGTNDNLRQTLANGNEGYNYYAASYNNYGNFPYDNVDDLLAQYTAADPGFQGVLSFVNYVEGIYVGYRFYETAYAEALAGSMNFNYDGVVQYPFGHGLSYTTFTQQIQNFTDSGDTVSFDVVVTNTGSAAGKDVVEATSLRPTTTAVLKRRRSTASRTIPPGM